MGSDRAKLFTRCCYAAVSIVALSVMFWIAWCLFGLTAVHVAEPQRRAIVHYSPTPASPTEETSASNAISKLPTTSSLAKDLAKGDFSPRDKNHTTNAERTGDLKPARFPTAAPKKGPEPVDSEEVLQARRVSSAAFENRPEEKVDSVPGAKHEIAPTRTLPQPETESRIYAIRDEAVLSKRDDNVQSSRRVTDDVPIVDRVPEFVKGETRRRIGSRPGYDDDDDERGSKGRYGSVADRGRESGDQYSKGDTRVYPDEVRFKEDRTRKGDEDEDDRYKYRDERPRITGDTADDGKRLRDEERSKTRNDERYRDRDDERYRDRDVDRYRDRDDDRYRYRDDERYRHRDDDRYRYRDDERYRYRDDERYRDRDDERYRDRDVDRYRDRDEDKLRDRDVDKYKDRDDDKLRDRDIDRYRDRDADKLRDRDADKLRDRDADKLRDRDVDRYRDRDVDRYRDHDVDKYKDREDDKLRERDADRYRDRDEDKLRDRDDDRYKDRIDDKYRDRDDDRYRDRDKDRYRGRDDDRYRDRDDDRYRDRDDDRYRPRYRDGDRRPLPDDADDKYGYRGNERYLPRDDDDEYGEKRYPVREEDRHRSRSRVDDDDNRDRSEKRGYRPRELSSSSMPESRNSEDILPPRNTAVGDRKPTTSSRYESSLRSEETVTDYDIPVRPYDEEEDRDRKRSRDDEEMRPFAVGISPTRTRDGSSSSRLTRSRGYDDDKRTDYISRPRDEDRTVIQGSRRSLSEKEATRLYTNDRDRSRPVESTRQYSDRREEVVLDRRSYASEDEYRKGSRRDEDDRRRIGDTRRIYDDEDDRYSRRRDRTDEVDDYADRRRDSYDDRPSSRPVRRYHDEDEIPSRRDKDRDVRIEDSRYVEKGSSRPALSIRDEERSYSRDDDYRPSRTYTDEDSSESGRRSRRPIVTREPPFVLSTTSPRNPGDSVTREKRYQDREPAVRPLSAKDVIEAANRQSDTSESNARQVFYPVFDPRLSNLTSPEVIQPSERRGTTITLRRRRRRRNA